MYTHAASLEESDPRGGKEEARNGNDAGTGPWWEGAGLQDQKSVVETTWIQVIPTQTNYE